MSTTNARRRMHLLSFVFDIAKGFDVLLTSCNDPVDVAHCIFDRSCPSFDCSFLRLFVRSFVPSSAEPPPKAITPPPKATAAPSPPLWQQQPQKLLKNKQTTLMIFVPECWLPFGLSFWRCFRSPNEGQEHQEVVTNSLSKSLPTNERF